MMPCQCGTIGAAKEIRFCSDHHRYWIGDRQLESVTHAVNSVYPRKSFDGVDPAVVEHARERGVRVDGYLTQYVTTGHVVRPAGEWKEVDDRLERCIDWWDKNVNGQRVECQKILYSERDGIAGTADFVFDGYVLDLKNTAQPEASWALQFGAYGEYADAHRVAALHSTKDSCRLIEYDAAECRELWREAMRWRATLARIEARK